MLPLGKDIRIGREIGRIRGFGQSARSCACRAKALPELHGKPDHGFCENFYRLVTANLLGEYSKMALANWASIRRRSKRLCAIEISPNT